MSSPWMHDSVVSVFVCDIHLRGHEGQIPCYGILISPHVPDIPCIWQRNL